MKLEARASLRACVCMPSKETGIMKRKPSCKINFPCRQKRTITGLAAMFLLAALTFAAPYLSAGKDKKEENKTADSSKVIKGLPIQDLTEDEAILQALNRLGFGTRPGDLERVKEMGLQKWIDRQLHPDSINDAALEARLDRFPTLKMSSAKLYSEFPQPQVAARKEGVSIEEYRKEQQAKQQQVNRQMTAMENAEQQDDSADASMDASGVDAGGKAKFNKQGYNGGDPNRSPLEFYQQLKTP